MNYFRANQWLFCFEMAQSAVQWKLYQSDVSPDQTEEEKIWAGQQTLDFSMYAKQRQHGLTPLLPNLCHHTTLHKSFYNPFIVSASPKLMLNFFQYNWLLWKKNLSECIACLHKLMLNLSSNLKLTKDFQFPSVILLCWTGRLNLKTDGQSPL